MSLIGPVSDGESRRRLQKCQGRLSETEIVFMNQFYDYVLAFNQKKISYIYLG